MGRAGRQRRSGRIWAAATAVLLLVAAPAAASFDDGIAALEREDYRAAHEAFRAAAEAGDPRAEFNIGVMYERGHGVSQDFTEAAVWYEGAAEAGYPPAFYNLGLLYFAGRGVPRDRGHAHALIRVAHELIPEEEREMRRLVRRTAEAMREELTANERNRSDEIFKVLIESADRPGQGR